MKLIFVLAGKDLRNLFLGPLFYIIASICMFVFGGLFYAALTDFAQASAMNAMQGQGEGASLHFVVFARHISLVNLMMIFAVSALSIRLFSDEKRNHTMSLLLTSPVTAMQITLGKFLAGLLTAWALVALSFLCPLSLRIWATYDWGPLIGSYIGLLLITGCYVAVGMFASSLTQNTALSVVMSLIFNVLLWFIGAFSDSAHNPVLDRVFAQLNVGNHFVNFIKGTISISSITFLVSIIVLMTFLTQRVVESNRWR